MPIQSQDIAIALTHPCNIQRNSWHWKWHLISYIHKHTHMHTHSTLYKFFTSRWSKVVALLNDNRSNQWDIWIWKAVGIGKLVSATRGKQFILSQCSVVYQFQHHTPVTHVWMTLWHVWMDSVLRSGSGSTHNLLSRTVTSCSLVGPPSTPE